VGYLQEKLQIIIQKYDQKYEYIDIDVFREHIYIPFITDDGTLKF
jgi:hypothetical protein